jgi:hypothetical protein
MTAGQAGGAVGKRDRAQKQGTEEPSPCAPVSTKPDSGSVGHNFGGAGHDGG